MLRSLYVMLDYHIAAADGVEGTIQDCLFDDESWIVHYLVAETPSPLGRRKVLLLPFAAGSPDWETKRLPVRLTSEQIRTSPPLESDMPISTQYETGMRQPGSHLRSMREVLGYSLQTAQGEAGTLEDFIIEDTLWGVHHAVVGLKASDRLILIPPESIRSISWGGKAAWVNLSLPEILKRPDFDPTAGVNRDRQHRLYDYYGRPIHPSRPLPSESGPEVHQR